MITWLLIAIVAGSVIGLACYLAYLDHYGEPEFRDEFPAQYRVVKLADPGKTALEVLRDGAHFDRNEDDIDTLPCIPVGKDLH
jgi:hypothetical protein